MLMSSTASTAGISVFMLFSFFCPMRATASLHQPKSDVFACDDLTQFSVLQMTLTSLLEQLCDICVRIDDGEFEVLGDEFVLFSKTLPCCLRFCTERNSCDGLCRLQCWFVLPC